LSLAQADFLLNEFEAGRLAVGVEGFSAELKDRFGLLEPELAAAASAGGADRWVLLHRDPAGHINEMEVAEPHNKREKREAFTRIAQWYKERANTESNSTVKASLALKATTDDPWTSIGDFEYSGSTVGSFQNSDQSVGSYRFRLTIYNLASNQDNRDWYRLDFQTDSTITNYEKTGTSFGSTSGNCGWWTKEAYAAVTVLSSGGDIFDFMPSATVGSQTQSYSIGGNITTSQAGVTGSYSKSYGTPDVTITPIENFAGASLHWKAGLTGCHSYSDYPAYDGASNAAKSTYVLDPSMIVSVPAGTHLQVITEDQSTSTDWRFTVEKDHVKCTNICLTIESDSYTSWYTETRTITCTTTSCS
jgi:hypothetical protein